MDSKESLMKKTLKLLWIAVLIAVIGFSFASCKGADAAEPTSATYKSRGSDGNTYELVITKDPNRAAYTPQAGDTYVLTITKSGEPNKKSTGTVATVSGGTFTLQPTGSGTTFTVTITGGNMTKIEGSITLDSGGSPQPAPGAVTPVTPPPAAQLLQSCPEQLSSMIPKLQT